MKFSIHQSITDELFISNTVEIPADLQARCLGMRTEKKRIARQTHARYLQFARTDFMRERNFNVKITPNSPKLCAISIRYQHRRIKIAIKFYRRLQDLSNAHF